MVTREIVIGDHSKADASPAAMLVQLASKFDSSIHVDQAEKRTNAKSIMGIMLPTMEPKPRAEDKAARSWSVSDMADSKEPMGMLNMV